MTQYRIPNLLTHLKSYTKPINPNYATLAKEHALWINACCSASEAQRRAWKRAEIPLLACRAYPESSVQLLRTCVDYLTAAFLLDQLTDAPTTSVEAQEWADIYKQAFRQTLEKAEGPAAVLNDLAEQMSSAIKNPYWSSLVRNNILLAEGMAKEAVDREDPDPGMTLEKYMKIRRDTIGARQLFDLGRWIYEIDIPQEVLTHPDIVKMEDLFVDIVSLANDLYSYKKECFECDVNHNYITIAFRDPVSGLRKNDLQGALDYTYSRFRQVLTDLENRKKALPSFAKRGDVEILRYIKMVTDVVVGTIQWSLECGRYGHLEVAETAEARNGGEVIFDMDQ